MRIASKRRNVPSASEFAVYFGGFKRYLHMTLSSKIVDFGRLKLLNYADKIGGIGHITVFQNKMAVIYVGILV